MRRFTLSGLSGLGGLAGLARLVSLAGLALGCHSAGPFGHSVKYSPLPGETAATGNAKEYDPVMLQRLPEEWHGKPVTLFGVVATRGTGPGGSAYLSVSVRRLEPRNACDDGQDESTCRTTVSDADFGVVHALVPLGADDDVGGASVSGGSLMRLVGTFGDATDPVDGGPVMRVTWYRHWPRGFYVTKSAARTMRQ